MRIIAFDQATNVTGWSILQDGRYIKSGTINLINKYVAPQRVRKMMLQIFKRIDQSMADMVVIEDIQNQSNNATFKLLAQLQGAIFGYCAEYEYPIEAVSPSVWRSELHFNLGRSIKRRSLKEQSIHYAATHCGRNLGDDEADATCIGYAWFQMNEGKER